ncbi:hypothetical protein [Paraglaciecola sp. L1A13]|uniref:hypothetical protein n=1 Tax=Paraglaciecola sp. L1A13 TaxID=2686359 RepID=UPI00131BD65F|nr:hypothetical protein [Paraglaciecola sp. L1A13]
MNNETHNSDVEEPEPEPEPELKPKPQSQAVKFSHQIASIVAREKSLKIEVVKALASGRYERVKEKLLVIEQLQKVMEWHRHSYLMKFSIMASALLSILVFLAVIPSNSLSLSTPGYLDISTQSVNFTLSEDLNWSGNALLSKHRAIAVENFRELHSGNHPQIDLKIDANYTLLLSQNGGGLTSLFIPRGSKIWLTKNVSEQVLKIDISTDTDQLDSKAETKLTVKLYGDLLIGPTKSSQQTYRARRCPANLKNCQIPRLVSLTGGRAELLRITLPLNDELDITGIGLKNLSFSDFQLSPSPIQTLRCAIDIGRFQLSSDAAPISINKGECVGLVSDSNRFSILSAPSLPIKVKFFGEITSLLLGTPEFNNQQTPSMLNWLLALPSAREIGALFAGIITVIGIIITTIGIKK